MKRWLQPSVIIALLGAVTYLLAECRAWREQSWKHKNGMEFYEQAFKEKVNEQ